MSCKWCSTTVWSNFCFHACLVILFFFLFFPPPVELKKKMLSWFIPDIVDLKLLNIIPKLLCFRFFAVLAVSSFTQWPIQHKISLSPFLNLYLSITQTDSSDNSDLEDDIILSLNEWGAICIGNKGSRWPVHFCPVDDWCITWVKLGARPVWNGRCLHTLMRLRRNELTEIERENPCAQLGLTLGINDCLWYSFI